MSAIVSFFSTLMNAVVGAIEFVVKMFSDMIHMLDVSLNILSVMPAFFTWLPPAFVAVSGALLGVVICYRFLGWGD